MTDYFEAACEIRRQVAKARFQRRIEHGLEVAAIAVALLFMLSRMF